MGIYPDSKVNEAYLGPTWGRQDPGGPHVGPMNLVIRVCIQTLFELVQWYNTLNGNSYIAISFPLQFPSCEDNALIIAPTEGKQSILKDR